MHKQEYLQNLVSWDLGEWCFLFFVHILFCNEGLFCFVSLIPPKNTVFFSCGIWFFCSSNANGNETHHPIWFIANYLQSFPLFLPSVTATCTWLPAVSRCVHTCAGALNPAGRVKGNWWGGAVNTLGLRGLSTSSVLSNFPIQSSRMMNKLNVWSLKSNTAAAFVCTFEGSFCKPAAGSTAPWTVREIWMFHRSLWAVKRVIQGMSKRYIEGILILSRN